MERDEMFFSSRSLKLKDRRAVCAYQYHQSAPPRPQTPSSQDPVVGKTFQSMISLSSPKDLAKDTAQYTVCQLHKKMRNHNQHFSAYTSEKASHDLKFTFLEDSRFSEWLGNSSSVRLGCLSKPGMRSVLVSASTVESLCTDDSSAKKQRAYDISVSSET